MISYFELWVSFKYLFPKTKEKFFSLITLFSFLGISLGVATLIIVMSVMNGFREELTSKILGINGHLKVQSKFTYNFEENNDFKDNLLNNSNEIRVHEVLTSQGLFNFRKYSSGILIKGVQSNFFTEREIFSKKISKSSLTSFNENEGIFIGEKLKEKLNLKLGDYITILSSKSHETFFGNLPRSNSFQVIGFFNIGMYEYDTSLVLMPKILLQKFLDTGNKISHYEILVKDFENLNQTKDLIRDNLPKDKRINDWRDLNPSLFNAIEVERNVMFLILSLIIVVAVFNLVSSMMILVSTKSRDIGVLRVLGVSKSQLLKIFIINGSVIGMLGTILGLSLGLLFCYNINEIKSFIELIIGTNLFSEEIYFFYNLPIILDFQQILKITSISLFLSFIATIYPSVKATRVDPVNLLKWD